MASQRNHRGFTRLDALVVGAVCLVLVLLVPVLHAMTQAHYFRTVCAAHIAEIGKTMFVYANDNETALPRAGGPTTTWGPTANWAALNRHMAYGLAADGSGGRATISASLFLLVKYYQTPTKLFVCPSDKGTSSLEDIRSPALSIGLANMWDFGPSTVSYKSYSFAYHMPYGPYALTTARDPNLAVAADRNPWIKSPSADPAPFANFKPDLSPYTGNADTARAGNAFAHQLDGQNVLFLDGRVTFETRAYCGLDWDNIYTISTGDTGSPLGVLPTTISGPANARDSLLVHDPDTFGGTSPRQ